MSRNVSNYGLILAGGRGTRFWPRSRRAHAKQVLRFGGDRSLIQQTVDRLRPVLPPEHIWILTNDHLHAEIVRQLPEVPKSQILAEPAQRNTAPAIGLAAHILQSIDANAVMGVFPADHMILKPAKYLQFVRPAFKAASTGKIVVLGIQPRWPETGYGYIEFPNGLKPGSLEPLPVRQFREKPDLKTATRYVRAGNFYWNAGMFFWRTSVLLDALRQFQPRTATLLASLPAFSDRQFPTKLKRAFPNCENVSIDYAVLEKAPNVAGFATSDFGWSDVGSWNAVYELLPRDSNGNVLRSEALAHSSSGNYVDAEGKLVALLGVKDLVIVDTPDALLIADRSRAQEVGDLVKKLEQQRRDDLL
ncbi:MAG TPA: mannose-1-phosphate guanylyltransferase [Bryobacteraceae bacterium]|jgi:mannose-1-phosphate guanylyltransferase|nr:mannose-1-phosphate guanylyltransferase [Bryobacteraceae bacterium]